MGSGLPSQRQCTALFLLLPPSSSSSTFATAEAAAVSTSTTASSSERRVGPVAVDMSSKSTGSAAAVVASGRAKRSKGESGSTTAGQLSCFFCSETGNTSSVTASLLESMLKVKSLMCIPLQLRDQALPEVGICSKCFDIVSQIEGWLDMLRQRIFDSHEGAVLYPETPPWLQALAAPSHTSPLSKPAVSLGDKRRATGGGGQAVPPKKMAAAAAVAANEEAAPVTTTAAATVPFLTIPVSSQSSNTTSVSAAAAKRKEERQAEVAAISESAMRSAIHSLTSLVNVVQAPAARTQTEKEVTAAAKRVVKEEPRGNSHESSPSPTPNAPFDILKRWCSVCSSSYHNDSVFKRHIVSCHPELCFKCELCGQLFATESSRDIHVSHGCCERPNNRTRVLRCTDCHLTFLGKYELKRHVLMTSHMGGVSGNMFNGTVKW